MCCETESPFKNIVLGPQPPRPRHVGQERVVAASVHEHGRGHGRGRGRGRGRGYEVMSFEANPQQSELGSEVTLMAKAGFIFVHNLFSPRSKRSPFLNFTPTPQQNP